MISDLLQNKVDMSQLVITKALAKTGGHENHMLESENQLTGHPRLFGQTSACRAR